MTVARDAAMPQQSWTVAAGFMLATLAVGLPRATPVVLLVVASAALVQLRLARASLRVGRPWPPYGLPAAIFLGWAALSSVWAPLPLASAGKVAFLALSVVASLVVAHSLDRLSLHARGGLLRGMAAALVLAGALLTIEAITDQAIARFVLTHLPALTHGYDKHINVLDGVVIELSPANANRRTFVWVVLLGPVVMWLASQRERRGDRALGACLLLLAVAVGVLTRHKSSQLVLLASAATLLIGFVSARAARLAAGGLFSALLLGCVPLALYAFRHHQYENPALGASSQQRIAIWGTTAQRIAADPWRGVGADATAALDAARQRAGPVATTADGKWSLVTARHAHNIYLQVWYELGVVGAIALLGAGVCLVAATARLREPWGTTAATLFAGLSAGLATSFGLWQPWVIALGGLGAITFVAAAGASPVANPIELRKGTA